MNDDHDLLFIPGPVEVDAELRAIMAMPAIGHRSQRAKTEIAAVCHKLKALFRTQGTTLFENCPATAVMEAAIRNLVPERSLHLTCGAFSERWREIARSCGRSTGELMVPWGTAHDPQALEELLRTSGPFDAVAITHNETSTGVLNPLMELCATIRRAAPEALIMVDAVTSLGGTDLQFDAWGVDLAFAGTQKCLALPPGLTVFALSDRALERAGTIGDRGYLLDFVRAARGMAKAETTATPCVPLIFALSRQLDRIANEGLDARFERHRAMLALTTDWADRHGFRFLPPEVAAHSPTVSCLEASGRNVEALARQAREAGFVMDRGYGPLKDKTFRIGHMGDHTVERLARLLSALA